MPEFALSQANYVLHSELWLNIIFYSRVSAISPQKKSDITVMLAFSGKKVKKQDSNGDQQPSDISKKRGLE